MNIESWNIVENNINIVFNQNFKQIKFVKMRHYQNKKTNLLLDSEEIELKYSKNKNMINLFYDNQNTNDFLIILIRELDTQSVLYSFFLELKNKTLIKKEKENVSESDLMGLGLSMLFKQNENENYNNDHDKNNQNIKICPIKNRNIFAKIKKINGT